MLSRKPEHDAGAGAQTPNQMTLEEGKWNDTTHLGGRQAPMFALEGRPYNVRARAAMLAAQGETMITVPSQQSTDFSKLQEDLGAYYREQRDKQIKSFVTELPTVEKIFPLYSPNIDKIEIVKRSRVRRAKLYHIREKATKEVNRQMRNVREVAEVEVTAEPEVKAEEKVEEVKA